MALAAKVGDFPFLMNHVSAEFRSSEGWTKAELQRQLALLLFEAHWTHLALYRVTVRGEGRDRAAWRAEAVLNEAEPGFQLEGEARREPDGRWRVASLALGKASAAGPRGVAEVDLK